MTTSPKIRNKISISADGKNKSLKDILGPMGLGTRILSVEAVNTPLYNTKATIRIKSNGEKKITLDDSISRDSDELRVILYNRIDISKIIPEGVVFENNQLPTIINTLNTKYYCDFTEDDLEIIENKLQAKATSLGYIGQYSLGEDVDPDPVEDITITCEGALAICQPVYGEGVFELVIDGVVIQAGTIDELKVPAREHGVEIVPTIKFATQ